MPPIDAGTRQLSVTEVLEIRLLPEEGLHFDEALEPAWLDAHISADQRQAGLELKASGPGRADLVVTPLGPLASRPPVSVKGAVSAPLAMVCVRCLSDLAFEVTADVDLTLLAGRPAPAHPQGKGAPRPKGAAAKSDGRVEDWSGEEMPELDALDESTYEEDRLDLPSMLREALLLALEMNPSCEDEAACDARTQKLLDEANRPFQVTETEGDPRWAPLRRLRGETED